MFLVYLFIFISLTFFSLSILGFYRFPDVYTRLHSSTLSSTFGFLFFDLAAIIYLFLYNFNFSLIAHIIIITLILLVISPSVAHTISRTAHRNGIKPKGAVIDKL
ncbi:MAG: cation:proton antiporter [Xanthomonadaceae bacterium]|nr:cation:proton antiporter [Rhodospirillaceae bacterium]NIA17563.1 cation:proton antiporter [Xanthomonadaceae bacterium]